MSCGDWLVRLVKNPRLAVYENHKCYAIVLSKKYFSEDDLKLVLAVVDNE